MSSSRIPSAIEKFFGYVETTNNYLQKPIVPTNGQRLTLADADVLIWSNQADIGAKLFLAKKDPLQKGPSINKKVKEFISDFKIFAEPQLDIIATCLAATTDDALMFNVVLVRKKRTTIFAVITEKCNVIFTLLGGGKIQFKCRTTKDAKRGALALGANAVEVVYIIGDSNTKAPSADEMGNGKLFSKASFILSLGTINSQKVLYIYFRWTNIKHPEVASPWSELQIIPIV